MKIRIVFLLMLISSTLWSFEDIQLKGTIGNNPIYMNLEFYPESSGDTIVVGEYFYESSLKDIPLRGKLEGDFIKMELKLGLDQEAIETFSLERSSGDWITGLWMSETGKVLPVKLSPIDVSKIKNSYDGLKVVSSLKETDKYNYVRTAFIKLVRDSISVVGDKSFIWFSERHCNVPFFRLDNGFKESQVRATNATLDEIHFQNILNQLMCSSFWEYSNGSNIDYFSSIDYLDDNLIGFEILSYWDCGGAHPDNGSNGYLIDLNNGKKYDLMEDVYSITGRDIYSLVDDQEHFKMLSDGDGCNYTTFGVWVFARWTIKKDGVSFTPLYPRAFRACEVPFLVPFSKMDEYRKSDFPYHLHTIDK